ncbi:hypothetical protein PG987_004486 [Apiospora arundinis]
MGKKADAEIAPPSKSRNPTYVLQIKEFIPMTQHIANTATATEPAIEVPSTLSATLSRVIWARRPLRGRWEAVQTGSIATSSKSWRGSRMR